MWRFQDAEVDAGHDLILSAFASLCGEACWGPEHHLAGAALGRELLQHSTAHFEREELLMRFQAYAGLEPHQRAHEQLRQDFAQVLEPMLRGQLALKAEMQLLRELLLSHIVLWDEPFAEWLGRKSLAAREEAGAGPAPVWPGTGRQSARKIAVSQQEDITVIFPGGKITLGDGDLELGQAVRAQLERGARKILVDFSQVSYLDSSGLGELVGCYTSSRNCGGELRVCGLNNRVLTLLKLTSLNQVFDVKETQAEALSAF